MCPTLQISPLLLFLTVALSPAAESELPIYGFLKSRLGEQRELEKRFDAGIQKTNFSPWLKWMSSKPHHVGSPFGKKVAEFIANKFREWGYETRIERFDVLFPTPRERILELTAPQIFKASLREPAISEDATSNITQDQLPTFNAYSRDGDVTAELVYVNYGLPEDYDVLAEKGIDVKGKIVLARYGMSWRGIKPKVAAEHGAAACIIYSDPKGDGYHMGDSYPRGPWRPEDGAQRGSVADLPQRPGDPLTPNIGATNGAPRLALKDVTTLTKIPVLPISYADALPLLKALEGPVAPKDWRGALPLTYHLGPGPAQVHLKLAFNWNQVPAYDVIATMRGSELPNEWVLRGNHHDGWVFGANDPLSGTIVLMEEARVIAELARSGWKPRRTLIFAAWDGEEPGLLGSTEWAEAHETELEQHAVAYLNGDLNTRGFLEAGGSHTLQRLVNEVMREVRDPETRATVRERLRAMMLLEGEAEQRKFAQANHDLPLFPLGSGSDYSPFLQHLGIPSLDLRYDDARWVEVYHSIYDSFDHYTRFANPGFDYSVTLAQTAGRVLLRLAQADVLPLDFNGLAERISAYTKQVIKLADDSREDLSEKNQQLAEKLGELLARPGETYVAPKAQAAAPYFNFAPLRNAAARLEKNASEYQKALQKKLQDDGADFSRLNAILLKAERALTDERGLPSRPWFRHFVYAPGAYTGYSAKTLPAVREAIEEHQWDQVEPGIAQTGMVIERLAELLAAARKEVE